MMNTSKKITDSDGETWTRMDSGEERTVMMTELRREVQSNPQHPLSGKSVCFLGRSDATDDFLIVLADGMVGLVHLTFSEETDPMFPWFSTKDHRLSGSFIAAFGPDWDDLDFAVV